MVNKYNTIIIGAGAAGMNCAVHLYELMRQKGINAPADKIAVITRGVPLGASRMSGSDKQTFYKMGTGADVADSAAKFAESLTAGGCCHEDLALIEGVVSLREFYHLVRSGVEFPHNSYGVYVGYKTDHDPYERATSAGPKTSLMMSECLQREVETCGISIYDKQEVAEFLTGGTGADKRIIGVVCVDVGRSGKVSKPEINVFLCENLVLAAGGPGEMYETSVYPRGQVGLHGAAFKAGLAAENLSESQFGLASVKFRWNVSGTYMQAIPRIYSTDADGVSNVREFLAEEFPDMSSMATAIFLKGYQWPFDAQRIENYQSSLIDMLVFREREHGRRVFMDFMHNPVGEGFESFSIDNLKEEAREYLKKAGAEQLLPIERLAYMNQPAIDIYMEHKIDLWKEPLEIAVCAQHNNGGFAVNKWWESNIRQTFVIGEMAGTHGVKRPGGAALNSGQVGGVRAAEYIVNAYDVEAMPDDSSVKEYAGIIDNIISAVSGMEVSGNELDADEAMNEIRHRMTLYAGHIRSLSGITKAFSEAVDLYAEIKERGLVASGNNSAVKIIQAENMALASAGYLKAIKELLESGGGSRGSYLVIDDEGRNLSENIELRNSIVRVEYLPGAEELFLCENIPVRKVVPENKAFETVWAEYRSGDMFRGER